ncbi:MAG: LacI family DNA-binding transcriptional regulator [Planctomycetota bacterium]
MKRKKVNIREIAKEAGVSTGSVSRVLNGFKVDPEITEKVKEIAKRLKYKVKEKNPSREDTDSVAILVYDKLTVDSNWTQRVLLSIQIALGQYNFNSIIKFIPKDVRYAPDVVKNVNACIIWGEFPEEFFNNLSLVTNDMPVLSYSQILPYENSLTVNYDHELNMHSVVEHLLASNHRKIAWVSYGKVSNTNQARARGFKKALEEYKVKLDPDLIKYSNIEFKENPDMVSTHRGYLLTEKLAKSKNPPTVIVYDSDDLAFGGMQALRNLNIKIPEEMSIISFDNMPISEKVVPALSSIGLDMEEPGKTIVESLDKLLSKRPVSKVVTIPLKLYKRDSVAVYKG